jgi:hypothetical protein
MLALVLRPDSLQIMPHSLAHTVPAYKQEKQLAERIMRTGAVSAGFGGFNAGEKTSTLPFGVL